MYSFESDSELRGESQLNGRFSSLIYSFQYLIYLEPHQFKGIATIGDSIDSQMCTIEPRLTDYIPFNSFQLQFRSPSDPVSYYYRNEFEYILNYWHFTFLWKYLWVYLELNIVSNWNRTQIQGDEGRQDRHFVWDWICEDIGKMGI